MQASPKDLSDIHARDGRDDLVSEVKRRVVPIPVENPSQPQAESWNDIIMHALVTSTELESLNLRPRDPLLADWLCAGDQGMIYAYRGVGKTWFALGIAKALSNGGSFGPWKTHRPTKVLYVDGEMPADLMRQRDRGFGNGELYFLNHEILFDRTQKVLNITNPEVQNAIMDICIKQGIEVVMLDNLSTLASGMKENDAFDWEQVNNWLLQFRRHRIAVILIHHAERNGEARGTSKREDATFWVIALNDAKKQADDRTCARFVSLFTKPSRNTQEDVPAYEWCVTTDPTTGAVGITWKPAQSLDVFRRCLEEGLSDNRQIAEEMRISPGQVSKLFKKAREEGWARKDGRDYALVGDISIGNEVP